MSSPAVEGLAVGLQKGRKVTKLEGSKKRQTRHKGAGSKKAKVRFYLFLVWCPIFDRTFERTRV